MVIMYVGTTTNIEAEGRSRTKLGLPGNQQELVEAVLAANPKTIVVEMNAGPLAIPSIAEKAPPFSKHGGQAKKGAMPLPM